MKQGKVDRPVKVRPIIPRNAELNKSGWPVNPPFIFKKTYPKSLAVDRPTKGELAKRKERITLPELKFLDEP